MLYPTILARFYALSFGIIATRLQEVQFSSNIHERSIVPEFDWFFFFFFLFINLVLCDQKPSIYFKDRIDLVAL